MKKIVSFLLVLSLIITSGLTIQAAKTNGEEAIKAVIEAFYNTQYEAYLEMEYKDIIPYLDMSQTQNQNKVTALKELVERKAYIDEKGYVEIDNRRLPIAFNYESIDINNNKAEIVIDIGIDRSEAYPSFVTVGINVFELEKQNGIWKISSHDHGEIFIFEQSKEKLIRVKDVTEIHTEMDELFKPVDYKDYDQGQNESDDLSIMYLPSQDYVYNASVAVKYAVDHLQNPNTSQFYYIENADCTNFVSQILWKGFGEHMDWSADYSVGWWAHTSGGSRNWEQVNAFWSYMTAYKDINTPGPRVNVVGGPDLLDLGGVMQIDFNYDGDYDHSVLLVDKQFMKFAQHTPNLYRYLWEYGNGTKRFFNPSYFKKML